MEREITCVFALGSRVLVGDTQGFVRCYDASRDAAAEAATNGAADAQEARLAPAPQWETRAAQQAILSLCAVPDSRASHERATAAENLPLLVAAGVASGEVVLFRNETEIRRLQVESAVLQLSARRGGEAQFVAADVLGSLYGVNQYEVLWKRRLDASDAPKDPREKMGAFLYPPAAQPFVRAVASVRVLDAEKTLASYTLVSAGQRHLAVTHEGSVCAWIRTRAPITTIASFSPELSGHTPADEDVVLVAGEEGIIYRLTTSRDSGSKFQFVLDIWTEVAFSVARILPVDTSSRAGDALEWVCVGVNGQVALFSDRECVREWNVASSSFQRVETNHCPVDMALSTAKESKDAYQQHVLAIAYPDTLRFSPLTTSSTDSL